MSFACDLRPASYLVGPNNAMFVTSSVSHRIHRGYAARFLRREELHELLTAGDLGEWWCRAVNASYAAGECIPRVFLAACYLGFLAARQSRG